MNIQKIYPFKIHDILFYSILLVISYFVFQHTDIIHTGGSAIALNQGHILDFYDHNKELFEQNNYLITTYILYAVWNLVIIIFNPDINVVEPGLWIFWYKLLTTIAYFFTAQIIFLVSKELKMSNTASRIASIAWISCPLAFFSQFIFGQYDIFTLLFLLLGILQFLRGNLMKFTLWMSLAITFKYFPIFIFFPILLLVEKRPLEIIKYSVIVIIPIAIEVLIFIPSEAFRSGVLHFGVAQRIMEIGIFNKEGNYHLNLFFIAWIVFTGFIYLKDITNEAIKRQWAIYIPLFILTVFYTFVYWHPQWIILITPFIVLNTFYQKRKDFLWFIDIMMAVAFIGFISNQWPLNVDAHLMNQGLLGSFKQINETSISMSSIFLITSPTFYFSVFIGLLILSTYLKFPKPNSIENMEISDNDIHVFLPILRLRFYVGVLVFIIPALIIFYLA